MRVSAELKRLAEVIGEPLYIVGGGVRDGVMGLDPFDCDIASALTPDELLKKIKDSGFTADIVNKRIGTLKIQGSDEFFEYTAFREDSYPTGGAHSPAEVKFTRDINTDARRRDFKMNALYCNVLSGEIIDPLGGLNDINNKIITTTRSPDEVFAEDGLRLIRLARQAAELGFEIDDNALTSAKKYAELIKDISKERIRSEIDLILKADKKYPSLKLKSAAERGIRILEQTNVLSYIMPALAACKGIDQHSRYHNLDVFDHCLKVMSLCSPEIRLAALYHDIGKPECQAKNGNMKGHSYVGVEIARKELGKNGLGFNKKLLEKTCFLISWHMFDLKDEEPEENVKLFAAKYPDMVEPLIELKCADIKASANPDAVAIGAQRLMEAVAELKNENAPKNTKELLIDGNDMIKYGIADKKRAMVLNDIWEKVILNPKLNTREQQLEMLEQRR